MSDDIQVIKRGLLVDPLNLDDLNIIDWHRYGPYWRSEGRAMLAVGKASVGHFEATVVHYDMRNEPKRDDFPEWCHAGGITHEHIARAYWNYFHNRTTGTLSLGDAPDFVGEMPNVDGTPIHIVGDFGRVSPITFLVEAAGMGIGDLWVSIPDIGTQVILECVRGYAEDIEALFTNAS